MSAPFRAATGALLLMAIASCISAAATMDDVQSWLSGAGLSYYTQEGPGPCGKTFYLRFRPESSTLDHIEVIVSATGDSGEYLLVYAKIIDLPTTTSADAYARCLEMNAAMNLARLAVADKALFIIHECPLRLVDRNTCLAMVADVAAFVDASYSQFCELVGVTVESASSLSAACNSRTARTEPPQADSEDSADLVAQARAGVVQIVAQRSDGDQRGTGFVVGPRFVLTSRHVVADAEKVWAIVAGRSIECEVLDRPRTDVDAVLLCATDELEGCHPLAVAISVEEAGRIGEDVWILGFPSGDPNLTVTRGVLASVTRREGVRCVKTTAVSAKGNSGGPVLNARGEVIGVVWQTDENQFTYAIAADEIQSLVAYATR